MDLKRPTEVLCDMRKQVNIKPIVKKKKKQEEEEDKTYLALLKMSAKLRHNIKTLVS